MTYLLIKVGVNKDLILIKSIFKNTKNKLVQMVRFWFIYVEV